MDVICGYCRNEVAEEAVKCGCCGEYLRGETCSQCASSIPAEAKVCKFCGHRVKGAATVMTGISLDIKASVLASVVFRQRLLPQEVVADDEKIVIKTPGIFRLWENADEIPWNKVAGFNYRDGIIWDKVEIETRGQKTSMIIGIGKSAGAKLRSILQNLEK